MDFDYSPRTREMMARLQAFFDKHIYPNEEAMEAQVAALNPRWQVVPLMTELRAKAKAAGLWNLFLPESEHGAGLSNVEYGALCEIMGRVLWSPTVFNCQPPDSGNMELLERYASEEQKRKWLTPLLEGDIRSAFLMTEPQAACSDATNVACSFKREGDYYIVNGRKWFATSVMDPLTKIWIVMGKTDTEAHKYTQQSMLLMEPDMPGIEIVRPLSVFGYDDAPGGHAEVRFTNVRVPVENIILGEGRGFEIAQGRLGPGRIHHCMRAIGTAERALELMCKRLSSRVAFGKPLSEQSVWLERIADARIEIEMCRLLTLKAAHMMDTAGNKVARAEIAMIKVAGPKMALKVIDDAIQAFGAAGVCEDPRLAHMYAMTRVLRIADGPDEVHRNQIARMELGKHAMSDAVALRG